MSVSKKRPELSISELDDVLNASRSMQSRMEASYKIAVVTPMFGGSSVSGEVDGDDPIRSTTIRGHLRFWWRATRGAAFTDTVALQEAEAAIFGDTKRPSKVKIWVESFEDKAKLRNVMKEKDRSGNQRKQICETLKRVNYVMFPFTTAKKTQFLDPSYRFKLCVRYDVRLKNEQGQEELKKLQREVELALWAWINFGGIGSRTRRGCGALYSPKFSPSYKNVRTSGDFNAWIGKRLEDYKVDLLPFGSSREWPTLSDKIVIKPDVQPLSSAWAGIIQTYQKFRRRANKNERNDGKTKIGRSHWPEADSLRRITGMVFKRHKPSVTITDDQDIAFPRAQFGLPIIFKFKDNKGEQKNRDPYTTQITPKGENKERLASPVIVKPIAIGDKTGIGAIVILNQPRLKALQLSLAADKNDGYRERDPVERIERRLADISIQKQHIYPELTYKQQEKNPLQINGQTSDSAIEAFLNSEEVREWKEPRKC